MKNNKCDISGEWVKLYEAFNGKDFESPADWSFQNVFKGNENVVTNCGGTKLVGGFERFGKVIIIICDFNSFRMLLPKRFGTTSPNIRVSKWLLKCGKLMLGMERNSKFQLTIRKFGNRCSVGSTQERRIYAVLQEETNGLRRNNTLK